ncbi:MAG: prephenate dehydratase [Planctomycetota bacterium]
MSSTPKNLQELRTEIDSVDNRLVDLINQRAELEIERLRLKSSTNEMIGATGIATSETFGQLLRQNPGPIPDTALGGVYREICNAAYHLARPTRVGYLGPFGTFSHSAAASYFGDSVDYENLRALEGVFEEVSRGHVDFGLVPIENSTGGAIIESLDSFAKYFGRVAIYGEIRLPISFCLLGSGKLENVTTIYSKSEALSQCGEWLAENLPQAERIAWQSTADAARHVKLVDADGTGGVAAIASQKAGEHYGLNVLGQAIENCQNNVTRFLVLAKDVPSQTGNDKTSLMFTCSDRPGSLVDILSVFKRHGINLSHIEKRPSTEVGSEYTFFVDILGHAKNPETAEILGEVRAYCKNLNVLGSYPVYQSGATHATESLEPRFASLSDLEDAILKMDGDLTGLINERANLVIQVGEFKRKSDVPIYAPHREAAVLKKIRNLNQGPLLDRTLESIYRELMSGSFALEKPLSIAFVGPEGEFSHLAAVRQFGSSVDFQPFREIKEVFQKVAAQQVDYGLVPIENSNVGGINGTLDSFLELHKELSIYGEVKLEVQLCLLASCKPEQVKTIYSTPGILDQCRNWLSTQYPHAERVRTQTLAAATRRAKTEISKNPGSGAAAIGSTLAGEIYGLQPLFDAIEDRQSNITRYLILSKSKTEISGKDKTSLMFTTVDRAGALVEVLEVFKKNAINLTHLEKRPSREVNWDYTFFVDLEGHRDDPDIAQIIGEARAHCKNLTVLGSFPACQRVL